MLAAYIAWPATCVWPDHHNKRAGVDIVQLGAELDFSSLPSHVHNMLTDRLYFSPYAGVPHRGHLTPGQVASRPGRGA